MIENLIDQIVQRNNERETLRRLRAAIKEDAAYQTAKELIGDGIILEPLLSSADAKVRKNAAALLGDLKIEEAALALYHAYEREETLFVRGTMVRALGETNPYPYLTELKERYDMLCGQKAAENEKKHIWEEMRALERILRREGEERHHTFIGWEQRHTILLTTDPGYESITAEQVFAYRNKVISGGVWAVTDRLREVVKVRTFRELLFPIHLDKPVALEDGPKALGEALAESKLPFSWNAVTKNRRLFIFEWILERDFSLEERSRYLKRAAAVVEEKTQRKLINAPENYEFEVRILLNKEKKIHVFLKMSTIPMERFSYRKETIASSIYPSTAAMLLKLARPYLKEKAQILDPCCGVGTMLIERHKLLPAREIYGIDIFGEAVAKARVNTEAAGMRVNFIHKDYLEFRHSYPFDEIIANMPLRGKFTKQEHDLFYREFFDQSERLLAPGGILILYSNEYGFVKKQLRLHPSLHLCKEYLIREKEQFWLFIINLRKKL